MNNIQVIHGSVGQGGANQSKDVRVVQRLLNDWLTKDNSTQLKVDGIVGSKTIHAISSFQKRNAIVVDSRVDVMGPTARELFNQHLAGLLKMLNVSRLRDYSEISFVNSSLLEHPEVALQIKRYADVLRMQA
jgi:peptidoglycan hydrolase-like protein with peptidoglycan-binding domain